jgi:hypothetical protein
MYTNNKNMTNISTSNVDYQFQNYLPIDLTKPVGFSLNSDIVVDTLLDDTEIYINSNYNGHIGGNENNYFGSGVKGDFNYQNNQLLGLGNDNENAQFFAVDGLGEISTFLNSTDSYFNLKFVENPASLFNNYLTFHLSYSTPCDTFSVSVPPDTTICRGESLQLNVVGGSQYEWLPATDLSCSTCPNPVFTGDSTQLYTVRIWNNDSCSVVRPVKITVGNCAGINENILPESFSIYPNPTAGIFNIDCTETLVEISIEVLDLLGKVHFNDSFLSQKMQAFQLNLSPGTYLIKISKEGIEFLTKRIVLE